MIVLGIDLATAGARVQAVDAESRATLAELRAPLAVTGSAPERTQPPRYAEVVRDLITGVTGLLGARAAEVRALSITGTSGTVVPADEHGVPVADAVLYDDDDLHWHFGVEDDGTLLVQVIRGKQLLGEILIQPREVAYVQSESKGEEEFLFECIVEAEHERIAAWHFTLSHDYSPEEQPKTGRWVH